MTASPPESLECGPSAFLALAAGVVTPMAAFLPWSSSGAGEVSAFELMPSAVFGKGFYVDYPAFSLGAMLLVLSLGLLLSGFTMGTHAGSLLGAVCGGAILAVSVGWVARLAHSSLADLMAGAYIGIAGGVLAFVALGVRWTRDSSRNRRDLMLRR